MVKIGTSINASGVAAMESGSVVKQVALVTGQPSHIPPPPPPPPRLLPHVDLLHCQP